MSSPSSDLTEPIDVYSLWIDATEQANRPQANSNQREVRCFCLSNRALVHHVSSLTWISHLLAWWPRAGARGVRRLAQAARPTCPSTQIKDRRWFWSFWWSRWRPAWRCVLKICLDSTLRRFPSPRTLHVRKKATLELLLNGLKSSIWYDEIPVFIFAYPFLLFAPFQSTSSLRKQKIKELTRDVELL